MKNRFSRRTLLKGIAGSLGAASVSLPLFDIFEGDLAYGQDGIEGPKRLINFFHGNGVSMPDWRMDASNGPIDLTSTDLPNQVRGLQSYTPPADSGDSATYDFRDKILMVEGLQFNRDVFQNGPSAEGGPHNWAPALLWTGADVVGGGSVWPDAPSLDQIVGRHIGSEPLVVSTKDMGSRAHVLNRLSYTGAGQPVTPIDDPASLYTRMFAGLDPANAEAARLSRERRKSMIDHLHGDLAKIEKYVGAHEREKLQRHVGALRSIEERLDRPPAECTLPDAPPEAIADADYPARSRAFIDLTVAALRCGLTDVANIAMTGGGGDLYMQWIYDEPVNGHTNYHYIGHTRGQGDGAEVFRRCVAWFYDQLGYLMWALASTPEGDGTMLDNTLIVCSSEVADGGHYTGNVPFFLAGNVGGQLSTGRYVDVKKSADERRNHQDLLTGIAQLFGVETQAVGSPGLVEGSLASVLRG